MVEGEPPTKLGVPMIALVPLQRSAVPQRVWLDVEVPPGGAAVLPMMALLRWLTFVDGSVLKQNTSVRS